MIAIEIKKVKGTKTCVIKRKLKFDGYKNCLEGTELENKINQPEKNKLDVDSLREKHKESIKINRLILKSQQRFRCEKLNIFTKEVKKIALSTYDDKRI